MILAHHGRVFVNVDDFRFGRLPLGIDEDRDVNEAVVEPLRHLGVVAFEDVDTHVG